VLVAGGGISGLATAWWLAEQGLSVLVWEAGSRPGGKIHTRARHGYTTECGAAMLMNFRPEVSHMLEASGLGDFKVARLPAANRYLLDRGRLVAAPTRLAGMLFSPLWSLRGRVRLALEPLAARRGHADESVAEFIRRRLGHEMLDKAFEPYLAGPLASDAERADAAAVLPRLTALEQRYGSLIVGILVHKLLGRRGTCPMEAFSFTAGMSTLVEGLAKTPGVALRTGHTLANLEKHGRGWRAVARYAGGETIAHARRIVLGVPADSAATLLSPLDADLGALLGGIDYAPVSVVHLGFDQSAVEHALDGSGFLTPACENTAVNGSLWTSSLFARRAPEGKVLITSYLGGARRPQALDWDDQRSIDAVLSSLTPLLGLRAAPEMVRIDRHHRGLPLYHGAYARRLRSIDTRLAGLAGLHLVANYRGGVSVRDRISCAHATAGEIVSTLGPARQARRATGAARRPYLVTS